MKSSLKKSLNKRKFGQLFEAYGQLTLEVEASDLYECLKCLKNDMGFELLIDLTAIDYQTYGQSDWETVTATSDGFSRGRDVLSDAYLSKEEKRFAIVYHLLSIAHNQRLRVRSICPTGIVKMPSVVKIWCNADWYEREVFDLFGILFEGHPNLRRILTDYGFVGHPFRKDFPLIGQKEIRYDGIQAKCVYEHVSIQARENIPRVIRKEGHYDRG